MHALRAGFRKTKEKRANHSLDEFEPILSSEDSNEASPLNVPLSWEQFSLKDDVQLLLADESVPNHFDENEETPIEDPVIDESALLGSKGWESRTEYEENIPPGNNQSTSKVLKIPKWKLAKFGGESEQPLLVESEKNSSRLSDVSRMTPKNVSGWDSIQVEEAATPLSQRPMNNSFGTVLSPRHNMIAICDTQTKNDTSIEEERSTQDNHMEVAVQQRSNIIDTFDPFDDVDDFGLENYEDVYEQPLVSSEESVESTSPINDHSMQNQEHHAANIDQNSYSNNFEEEEYILSDYDHCENGGMCETEDAEGQTAEESVTSDFYEENEEYIENEAVQPAAQQGNQFYQNQNDSPQEYSSVFRVDNEETSNAVEDDSSLISNGIYSVRKLEHIKSIYESKFLRDDPKSPENEEGSISQSGSESLEDDGSNNGLRFVALFTEYSGILRQRTEQERAMSILLARGISNVVKIDGSSEENTDVRNMLFEISGEKGKYPQFFLQKDDDVIVYLGNYEWIQYMNDIGSMNDETIFGISLSNDTNADVTHSAPFADRVKAIDAYKKEPFRPEISPYHQTEDREFQSHEFVDIDSQCYSDIKSVDVEEEKNMEDITRTYGSLAITNEADEDMISCASTRIQNRDHGDSKAPNDFTDALSDEVYAPESGTVEIGDEASNGDHDDSSDIVDGSYVTQNEEESDMETASFSFRERRAALESAGALLDGESVCEEPSQFDIPIDGEADADGEACNDLEKSEQSQEEMEKQAKRRARWKRRIIAEHLGSQYVDGMTSSGEAEDPIGASENEIEMINTFMTVLGSDFDGSLSSRELEKLHRHRAKEAGLTDEFINKMLSAKVSPTASDAVYDDREFTMKTPQPKSKFGCFVETFWAESSNVVGGDMVQNIQAALSGDGDESKRSLRTTGSTDSKSRWRSVEMIESIKASLSGDSNEKSWRPVDMIGTIKATLSGDGSTDVIGSIKAAFSTDGTEKAKTESKDPEKEAQSSVVADDPNTPEDLYEC